MVESSLFFFQVFKANVEAVKGGALWLENMPLAKKKQAIQLANRLKCDPCCSQSGQQGSKKKKLLYFLQFLVICFEYLIRGKKGLM